MAESVYSVSTILSLACAGMLLRGYLKSPSHLLLWSSACFALLAVNNLILFLDVMIFPELDFGGLLYRNVAGALAGSLLLFGLIWELS